MAMIFVDGDFVFVEADVKEGARGSEGDEVTDVEGSRSDQMLVGSTDEARVKDLPLLQLCSEGKAADGGAASGTALAEVEEVHEEAKGAASGSPAAYVFGGAELQESDLQAPQKKQKGGDPPGFSCAEAGAAAVRMLQGASSAMVGLVAPGVAVEDGASALASSDK